MENLNINSTSNKFGNLKLIIQGKTDILVITETKTSNFSIESICDSLKILQV